MALCSKSLELDSGLGGAANGECPSTDVLLCESFDEALSENYRVVAENAEVSAESCLAQRGSGSIAFSGELDEGYGQVQMPLAEPVSSGPLYARMWLYVPSRQEPALARVFALGADPDVSEEQVGVYLTPAAGLRVTDGVAAADSPADSFPLDEWFCLELALDVASNGNVNVILDGAPVFALGGLTTLPGAGPLEVATVFGSVSDPQTTFEFSLDELVVATSAIGCE